MTIAFYRDDCGCVGEPRLDLDPTEAADEAAAEAHNAAEQLAVFCDRFDGDAGDDAGFWEDLASDINALLARVQRRMPPPAARLSEVRR